MTGGCGATSVFSLDDGAKWHPSGFSPVFIGFGGSTAPLYMMGFTTLQCPVRRYMLSRSKDNPEHGKVMELYGEARRVVVGIRAPTSVAARRVYSLLFNPVLRSNCRSYRIQRRSDPAHMRRSAV